MHNLLILLHNIRHPMDYIKKRLCIFSKTPKDLFGLPLGMEFINLMVIILKITKTEKGIIMDSITAE
jgi:hypothetical protein